MTVWALAIAAGLIAVVFVTNLLYQVLRKPTEIFALLSGSFNKTPAETWHQYGALFREYSTANVPAELLAALAQVEGAGNPIASTYWRWRVSWNPLNVYQPASSSVGMYQMTDAAFEEARHYCIQDHNVVERDCSSKGFDSRVVPRRAIELTVVYLDRNVSAILIRRRSQIVSPRLKQQIAVIIHLCGVGPARAFAGRGFHLIPGERCGDHEVANYLSRVKAAEQIFRRLARSQSSRQSPSTRSVFTFANYRSAGQRLSYCQGARLQHEDSG